MDEQHDELDVFLSFVASDDTPVGDGKTPEVRREPCVTFLREMLSRYAKNRLGRELRIADSRDAVSPSSAAAFVAVVSPDYVNDPDAMLHVDEFLSSRGDRPVALFMVVRAPVPEDQLIEGLSDARVYALGDPGGETLLAHVIKTANNVAIDLVPTLSASRETERGRTRGAPAAGGAVSAEGSAPAPGAPPAPPTPPKTVLLAHTEPGLADLRERLRGGLERRGVRVLPEGPAPTDISALTDATRAALAESDLSVHLLGDAYDDAADLELAIAAEDAGTRDRPRHVWLASAGAPADPRLGRVYRDVEEAEDGTVPYRRVAFESFETAVQKALEPPAEPKAVPAAAEGYRYVYLVYDRRDLKWVDRLTTFLTRSTNRLRILRPLVGDEERRPTAEEIDAQHRSNLEVCDSCLVVYGEAPESWFAALSTDWVRLERVWRPGEDVKRGYCLFDPMTEQKVSFREPGNIVIKAGDRVRPDDLVPFIDVVAESGSGAAH